MDMIVLVFVRSFFFFFFFVNSNELSNAFTILTMLQMAIETFINRYVDIVLHCKRCKCIALDRSASKSMSRKAK